MEEITKATASDFGYTAAKAVLGSIPLAGAAAAELFGFLITPPLEKRRQK
jgi:hypothetical protein